MFNSGHCVKLAPEYAKAAQILAEANSPIKLAKVDSTVEKDLTRRFKVTAFPTIFFFK